MARSRDIVERFVSIDVSFKKEERDFSERILIGFVKARKISVKKEEREIQLCQRSRYFDGILA